MFLLRREFGISAYDAEHVLPLWEREMLMRKLGQMHDVDDAGALPGEPLSAVPGEFAGG